MSNSTIIYYCDGCFKQSNSWSRHEGRMRENDCMIQLLQYAKPQLEEHPFISKSHSNGNALFVISTSPVGCDLEQINWEWSMQQLEQRMAFYLSKEEIKYILEAEEPHKSAILAWTRKESYYKVHQQRKVLGGGSIVSDMETLQGNWMKFESRYIGNNIIATCYHQNECNLEWYSISYNKDE